MEPIKGAAILPNLPEWCALVGESGNADYWRRNLNVPEALQEMAFRSFRHLGNFEYHIVKCDRDGAVLFFPHPKKRNGYALYHVRPIEPSDSAPRSQVGSGDVMVAVFALEFPTGTPSTDSVLRAFQSANAAVACYREMAWHQMPSRRDVEQKQRATPWVDRAPDAEISKAALFLPKGTNIDMSVCETAVKGLFSQDKVFKRNVQDFMTDITAEWTLGSMKSIVLGAQPGTGKTTIMKAVQASGSSLGIRTVDMTRTEHSVGKALHELSPGAFRRYFRELRNPDKEHRSSVGKKNKQMRNDKAEEKVLIFVDEALKEPTLPFLRRNAATLLHAAHAEGVRFLFLSAEFKPELEQQEEWRELFGRSRTYYLSSLEDRPFDIPYIIAARFFQQRDSLVRLRLDGRFLLAVTDFSLNTPEPRAICAVVDEVLKDKKVGGAEHTITLDHLPDKYLDRRRPVSTETVGAYEFRR